MITLSIPGSAVIPLNEAASQCTTKSHRGRLATRLSNAEVRNSGGGKAYTFEVPEGLVRELRSWVDDAKPFARTETQRDAVRRLRRKVTEIQGA